MRWRRSRRRRARGSGGTLEEMEAEQIRLVLEQERGHVAQTAERLGIPRSTLYVKLKTLDIDPAQYR